MKTYQVDGTYTVTTKQKRKKKWIAETSYITGEGETEKDAMISLANKLRYFASEIEDFIEEDGTS
jgi:hypothetical protein